MASTPLPGFIKGDSRGGSLGSGRWRVRQFRSYKLIFYSSVSYMQCVVGEEMSQLDGSVIIVL